MAWLWPAGWRGVVSERSDARRGGRGAGDANDGEVECGVTMWRDGGRWELPFGICANVVLISFFAE